MSVLESGELVGVSQEWARTAGWQFDMGDAGVATVRWKDDVTLVDITFFPAERCALVTLCDRRHVVGSGYDVRYEDRPRDLLGVLTHWGTPAPARFPELLGVLVAVFGEVYAMRDGPAVPVDAEYLERLGRVVNDQPAVRGQLVREPLLAVIGQALGLAGPFRERRPPEWWWHRDCADPTPEPPGGFAVEMLNGVVDRDRDRVAWVERHTFPPDENGECWVNIWLNLAGDGVRSLPRVLGWAHAEEPRPHVSVSLTDERDDRITGVPYLKFFNETLVAVYERSGCWHDLCRLTLSAPGLSGVQVDRVELGSSVAVLDHGDYSWDDIALCHLPRDVDRHGLLMRTLSLPDLAPRVPIPLPEQSDSASSVELHDSSDGARWVERVCRGRDGEPVDGWPYRRLATLRLPSSRQRGFLPDPELLWDRLRCSLAGSDVPADGADILIGAVARPFWDESAPSALDGPWQPWSVAHGPWWFPAAWYRFLRGPAAEEGADLADEAAGWLRWLDRLAAENQPDSHRGWAPEWSREEGVERFAMTHLRRQAGPLAAACRAGGRLPVVGDYHRELRGRLPVTAFPAGFARAWRRMPDRFRPGGAGN